jgi:hypothetical protein
MKHLVGLAIVSLLMCVTAHAQIHHVVRMNTEQIQSRPPRRLARLSQLTAAGPSQLRARLQEYRSAHDNALAVAILDSRVDERDIPRYSARMTSKEMVSALAEANQDEVNRERKQREWMTRTGIN